jgi:hypothetical protein
MPFLGKAFLLCKDGLEVTKGGTSNVVAVTTTDTFGAAKRVFL